MRMRHVGRGKLQQFKLIRFDQGHGHLFPLKDASL